MPLLAPPTKFPDVTPLAVLPAAPIFKRFRLSPLAPLALAFTFSVNPAVAAKANKEEIRAMKRDGVIEETGGKPKKRDDNADARGPKSNPADAQARGLDRLRERLVVPDDTEWTLMVERITKIEEIRRTLWTSAANVRSPAPGAEKGKRGSSANPERDALRSAVTDNLPDAEIKSRLARAHEIHRQNEARLAKAQADLRAILSIRQEAVAVMAGLLPP